jgi:hypothetical protein
MVTGGSGSFSYHPGLNFISVIPRLLFPSSLKTSLEDACGLRGCALEARVANVVSLSFFLSPSFGVFL